MILSFLTNHRWFLGYVFHLNMGDFYISITISTKVKSYKSPGMLGFFLLLLSSLLYLLYRLISFYTVCRFGFRRILFDMICGSKNCRRLNLYFLSFVTYSQRGCPMWTFVPYKKLDNLGIKVNVLILFFSKII